MDPIIQDAKKTLCIVQLTNDLPVLRAALDLSQEEVASKIGLSRQTYNAIECKKRDMGWNTCVTLTVLFASNEKTRKMMENNSDLFALVKEVFKK